MARTRSFTPLLGLLLVAALVAGFLAIAGASRADDRNQTASPSIELPPVFEDGTYRTEVDNAGPNCTGAADGDVGNDCIFRGDARGPTIEFNIPVGALKGPKYTLNIRAWDVDSADGENDNVWLNGVLLGPLVGSNGAWSLTSFSVTNVVAGNNCLEVDIDTGNGGWCTNVSYGSLFAPQPPNFIPGLSPFGLLAASMLLLAAGIWTVRRRRVYEA